MSNIKRVYLPAYPIKIISITNLFRKQHEHRLMIYAAQKFTERTALVLFLFFI